MIDHQHRRHLPKHQRYVAFRRVKARTHSGSWCEWTVEATGPTLELARESLRHLVREEFRGVEVK